VVPIGIALGEVVIASAGRGVALERSARAWLSTISRASSMNGSTVSSCSRSLLWLLSWSDILVPSECGRERRERKKECRGW
jgi:hypothetical protein